MPLRGSPNRSLGKLIRLFNSRNIGPDGVNGDTDQRLKEIPGYIQATGGSTVDSPTHRYHVFTASGSLVVSALSGQPTVPSSMEYVVVAGGGGAGGNAGGGGGAGGVLHHPGFTAVAQTYTVVVGEGGNSSSDGGDSYFGPTAILPLDLPLLQEEVFQKEEELQDLELLVKMVDQVVEQDGVDLHKVDLVEKVYNLHNLVIQKVEQLLMVMMVDME